MVMIDIPDKARFASLRIFNNLADKWGLTLHQKCTWLGGIGEETYTYMLGKPEPVVMDEEIVRISYALKIYNYSHCILSDLSADKFMKHITNEPMFEGRTPLDYCLLSKDNMINTILWLEDWVYGGDVYY